ncbi:hypothetical protein BDV28DRAFT_161908 [Aspergillus coremiiformis]|uniref:F-box domain-containing protein n=1 Tax=Aspergillus coremiiformis TaxID=138285 RepID=A0A5N6Z511_9EURO|nr:hypothetical protein BDV28DRAFT_161908 [Aspergillus coremiiformis]
MAIFTAVLAWISSHWYPQVLTVEPSHHRGPNLDDLPTELLDMVAEYLSLSDRACLSLCNRRLLSVYGYRHPFPQRRSFRSTLLTRLSRDLPSAVYCHDCLVLHRQESIAPPGPAWQPSRCHAIPHTPVAFWCSFGLNWATLYQFHHLHLQLAMKRYYCGPSHGVSTDSLRYIEVQRERSLTCLLSVDAQIIEGPSLCLRVQTWALAMELLHQNLGQMWICAHLRLRDPSVAQIVRRSFIGDVDYGPVPNTYRCQACGVDFQIKIASCGFDGVALIITKWLELGPGLVPTEIRWRRHLPGTYSLTNDEAIQSNGYIRSQFERKTEFPLKALTDRNHLLLKRRAYTRLLDWWKPNCWILQGNKRLPLLYVRPGDIDFYWRCARTWDSP